MNIQSENIPMICPREEIFPYIDGELDPQEELDLECHLVECKTCTDEVNAQKKVSNSLEIILEEEMKNIKLPENFSKVVAAKAESNVRGMRQRKEIIRAFAICAALLFFLIVGFGSKVTSIVPEFQESLRQLGSIGGFAIHLGYEVMVAIAVILRSILHNLVSSTGILLLLVIAVFAAAFFSLSRLVSRYNRL